MIGVLVKLTYRQPIFWFAFVGAALALALGNAVAYVMMHRKKAEIFFVGDSFSIISVSEITSKTPIPSFPIKFANPSRVGSDIHLHFQDEVVILKRDDWEELDLIWDYLNPVNISYTVI